MLHFSRYFWPVLIVVLTGLFLLHGCDKAEEKKSAIIREGETIVVVNNKRIPLAQFQRRLSLFLKKYNQLLITDEKQLTQIKDIIINQMIDEELINQEASRKGIKVSEEEIEVESVSNLSTFREEGFSNELDLVDLTEAERKDRLKQSMIQKKLAQQEVIAKIPITKREISSYYETHRQEFTIPRAYRVSNITLGNRLEAVSIRLKILRGTNFKFLVREHSISPDKAMDGDIGYVEKGDLPLEMESEIFKSSFDSDDKNISDIVRSQDGFHIFKRERYRRKRLLSQKEARPKIKQILVDQKQDAAYQKWIEKLKSNAKISIDKTMLGDEEGF
ncbi:MAG: SurA N-terminal domain-containing protein [SAR324 cluster bacterium]|nr:SurA N-terminal domain-containing protein [SAR324 cluster bacterium]